jgi:hypothetical protein
MIYYCRICGMDNLNFKHDDAQSFSNLDHDFQPEFIKPNSKSKSKTEKWSGTFGDVLEAVGNGALSVVGVVIDVAADVIDIIGGS